MGCAITHDTSVGRMWRLKLKRILSSWAFPQLKTHCKVTCLPSVVLLLAPFVIIMPVESDGVPEALQKLRLAGMKVWMLTGDKQGTAVNIGYVRSARRVIISLTQECFAANLVV